MRAFSRFEEERPQAARDIFAALAIEWARKADELVKAEGPVAARFRRCASIAKHLSETPRFVDFPELLSAAAIEYGKEIREIVEACDADTSFGGEKSEQLFVRSMVRALTMQAQLDQMSKRVTRLESPKK